MKDKRTRPGPARPGGPWVELRGPSGRLYGYYNPAGGLLELKRNGNRPEVIALGAAESARKP